MDLERRRSLNLARAELEGATLIGADLRMAILTGANLQDANLAGADLRGAILTGVNLNGANLTGVMLDGAILPQDITEMAKDQGGGIVLEE